MSIHTDTAVRRRGTSDADRLVGKRLQFWRCSRGLTQTELGREIGVTFQQVQKYENGSNRISAGRLAKVAGILGVGITQFFPPEQGGPSSEDVYSKDEMEIIALWRRIHEPHTRAALKRVLQQTAARDEIPCD